MTEQPARVDDGDSIGVIDIQMLDLLEKTQHQLRESQQREAALRADMLAISKRDFSLVGAGHVQMAIRKALAKAADEGGGS